MMERPEENDMLFEEEYAINQAAYLRLRAEIDSSYPKGRFVALGGGQVIADAESIDKLLAKLNELGWEPLKTMAVQAGDDTPEYLEILSPIWISTDE
jgi:hypothetical protein